MNVDGVIQDIGTVSITRNTDRTHTIVVSAGFENGRPRDHLAVYSRVGATPTIGSGMRFSRKGSFLVSERLGYVVGERDGHISIYPVNVEGDPGPSDF